MTTEGKAGEALSRAEIERQWRIGRSVIPAMAVAGDHPQYAVENIPGRGRTRYFYRRMAIAFAQSARRVEWVPGSRATHVSLAKNYLAGYRALCALGAAGAAAGERRAR
jgi:hypothetical protein